MTTTNPFLESMQGKEIVALIDGMSVPGVFVNYDDLTYIIGAPSGANLVLTRSKVDMILSAQEWENRLQEKDND